jgi:hypothetical protein
MLAWPAGGANGAPVSVYTAPSAFPGEVAEWLKALAC